MTLGGLISSTSLQLISGGSPDPAVVAHSVQRGYASASLPARNRGFAAGVQSFTP